MVLFLPSLLPYLMNIDAEGVVNPRIQHGKLTCIPCIVNDIRKGREREDEIARWNVGGQVRGGRWEGGGRKVVTGGFVVDEREFKRYDARSSTGTRGAIFLIDSKNVLLQRY